VRTSGEAARRGAQRGGREAADAGEGLGLRVEGLGSKEGLRFWEQGGEKAADAGKGHETQSRASEAQL
jgi:hypothetical protein